MVFISPNSQTLKNEKHELNTKMASIDPSCSNSWSHTTILFTVRVGFAMNQCHNVYVKLDQRNFGDVETMSWVSGLTNLCFLM
jgi:hypothetical protein